MMLAGQHPHDVTLPSFSKLSFVENDRNASPRDIAQTWLDRFTAVLAGGDASALSTVFHKDSWWRDHVAFTWDLRTLHGITEIVAFVSERIETVKLDSLTLPSDTQSFPPSVVTPVKGLDWVQSMFFFHTAIGRGRGFLRLAQGHDGVYNAHMLYTALDELKGHEETLGSRRPLGGKNSLEGGIVRGNWLERRQRTHEFGDEDPQVLIIGAGKSSFTSVRLLI